MNSYDKIVDVEDELIYNPFLNKKEIRLNYIRIMGIPI